MTSEQMFNKIMEKIDDLPCIDHGEAISRMQGEKSGANSVEQKVIQQKTLSYKVIGIIVTAIMVGFKVFDMVAARL